MTGTIVKLIRGRTVRLTAKFYSWAGALADLAAAPTVNIYNTAETVIATGTASSISTGYYYYQYAPPADGDYTYEFTGTGESTTVLERATFTVVFV